MNKKFLILLLLIILLVNCKSKQDLKGIEQYNGNYYASGKIEVNGKDNTLWISIKDCTFGAAFSDNTNKPAFNQSDYMDVTGSGTDYNFQDDIFKGTLRFSSDGSSVTVKYEKCPDPNLTNKDIKCYKK